tara:strand:+ start:993 stop:1406 length:414 start_codon:yes stop_codon:yes gene_type:complete
MLLDYTNPEDVKKGKLYNETMIISKFKVELRRILPCRSLSINKYLHVCIDLYAIEFGYTAEEAKTDLKRRCKFIVYEKHGTKFLKETKKLNNKECSEFVEWIRNYAAQHNLYIPTSEEYKTNKFNIDKEINKNKEYL